MTPGGPVREGGLRTGMATRGPAPGDAEAGAKGGM